MKTISLICAALVTGLISLSANAGSLPDYFQVRYAARFGGLPVGDIVKTVRKVSNGRYEMTAKTEPKGLASLLDSADVTEEATFQLEGDGIRPLDYRITQAGNKGYDRKVSLDWKNRKIKYNDGRVEPMPGGTILDAGTVFFSFMPKNGHTKDFNKDKVTILDGRRATAYTYTRKPDETVETPSGTYKCMVIERNESNSDKINRVKIWLAYDKHLAPVKLTKEKSGKPTVSMVASQLKGL